MELVHQLRHGVCPPTQAWDLSINSQAWDLSEFLEFSQVWPTAIQGREKKRRLSGGFLNSQRFQCQDPPTPKWRRLVIVSRFQPFLAGPLDLPELSDLFPHSGQIPCLLLPWRSVQEASACGDTVRLWQEAAKVQSDCMPKNNKHSTDDQQMEKMQKQETGTTNIL